MSNRTIKVSDFTRIPGPRFKVSGDSSAEAFWEEYIEPAVHDDNIEHITIDFSGTWGYPPSFTSQLGIYLKDELGSIEAVTNFVSTYSATDIIVEDQFWSQLEEESTT